MGILFIGIDDKKKYASVIILFKVRKLPTARSKKKKEKLNSIKRKSVLRYEKECY